MLPYRYAHWFILALFIPVGFAFWSSYFSVLGSSPVAFHIHGISSTLWILMLAAQSWSIHNGQWTMHKLTGRSIFVMTPFFMVGNFLVIQTFQPTLSPFHELFAQRLSAIDTIATLASGWLIFQGLKNRHTPQLHGRYMLATVIFLLAPIFSRLLPDIVPPLAINSLADFGNFAISVHISLIAAALLCFWLWFQNREYGLSWLVVGGLSLLEGLAFEVFGKTVVWSNLHEIYYSLPVPIVAGSGLIFGIAVVWLGWQAGSRPAPAAAE